MVPSRLRSDSSTVIISGARLSLHKLAKELQVDRSYLDRIFRGKRECSRKYAKMIAARLHIPVEDLLKQIERLNQTTSQTTDQTTEATRETLGY